MKRLIYLHLDTISNAVLMKGIPLSCFHRSMQQIPDNLLLLNPMADEGEYESHTGLKVIRSQGAVQRFMQLTQRHHEIDVQWIDFNDLHLLKQLTPVEISELLYFGHMKTQLHSPFFYKLQNDYVVLRLSQEVNKIYYRHLDNFYRTLSYCLQTELSQQLSSSRGFFKKNVAVSYPQLEVLRRLRPVFQEGAVLHFDEMRRDGVDYLIPIYVVEDQVRNIENLRYQPQMRMATLIYHAAKQSWQVQMEEWDPLINMRSL